MTIDEAIVLQTQLKDLLPDVGFNKYIASTHLGIEALKVVDEIRHLAYLPDLKLLPGETEDDI